MQKLLHTTCLLVAAWCLSLFGLQSASASHFQGGQLTYELVPNTTNQYKVILRIFRDCSGSDLPTTVNLLYRNTGCSGGTTVPMPLVGGSSIGAPYCATAPSGPSPCGSGLPTNYETGRFETTVTLPPAAEWRLSVEVNARPTLRNVDGDTDMYYEATLNNLVGGQSITNNSPQFDLLNVPIPFVCWKQQTTLNFTATDVDGDELVYSLAEPLQGCNDPLAYEPYSAGGFIDLSTPGSPCAALITSSTGTPITSFSPTFPIPSFAITGSCPLKTATPSFLFNAATGSFTFTPAEFTPGNTTALQARNKYAVVGKVSEYRRINGVRTLIGSVRRDILVVVIDCSNSVPGNPVATGNNTNSGVQIVNSTDSTFITASTCNYTRVLVRFSDPDPNDLLTVTFPVLDPLNAPAGTPIYLPGDVGTFRVVGNGTKRPVGIFDIQPDVFFEDRTFRIPVQIRDNGCPIIGQQSRVIVLTVKGRKPARVVASTATPLVCAGTAVPLTATPTRPDSALVNGRGGLATYTYRWEAANGLAAADQNKQTISVRPTQTTRYRVSINAVDFRQLPTPTCVDTASILVRVAPALNANFTSSERAGFNLAGIQTAIPPRIFTFVNTSNAPRPSANDTASVTSVWTYKRVRDNQGNAVAGTETRFGTRYTPGELTLREGGEYEIKLRINNKAGSTDCAPSEKIALVKVPDFQTPNVFTPNKDGMNDTFVLTTEEVGSKVQIFNRWGRMVKEYANYQNNWDGGEQPAGVYYYLLTDRNGKTTKGWVELAR